MDKYHCQVFISDSPADIGYKGMKDPGFHFFHPIDGQFPFRETDLYSRELYLDEKLTAHYLSFKGVSYLGEADRKAKASALEGADWHPLLMIEIDSEDPTRVIGANYPEGTLRSCVEWSDAKSIYVRDKRGVVFNYSLEATENHEQKVVIKPVSVEAYINKFDEIYRALSGKPNGLPEHFVTDIGDGSQVISHKKSDQGAVVAIDYREYRAIDESVRFDPKAHPNHVPAVVRDISAQLIREAREEIRSDATQDHIHAYLWNRSPFKGKFAEFPEAGMIFENPINIFSIQNDLNPKLLSETEKVPLTKRSNLVDSVVPVFSRPEIDGRLLECRVVTSWDAPKEHRVTLQFLRNYNVVSQISTGKVTPLEELATMGFVQKFYENLKSAGAVAAWDLQVALFNGEPEKIARALYEAENNAENAVQNAIKNLDLVVTESKPNGAPVTVENSLFKWSWHRPDILVNKGSNKVIDQGCYIEDGIPEGISDERIIGASKQFWRELNALREVSDQTRRLGSALVITVEHSTPAFEDTGASDEMRRVVVDAAHRIKNGKDFPVHLVDTNGATVGSIREVTAFPFMPALEGYFAYGSVDVSGMPREKVIQVLESFDEKKGAFYDGEQQVGFINLEREHENVLTADAVQQSEIDHSL